MKKIDSLDMIKSLRKEDIILLDKNDIFRILHITDISITVFKSDTVDSYLTILPFEDLISGEWYLLH
jgi:hypothetical protein